MPGQRGGVEKTNVDTALARSEQELIEKEIMASSLADSQAQDAAAEEARLVELALKDSVEEAMGATHRMPVAASLQHIPIVLGTVHCGLLTRHLPIRCRPPGPGRMERFRVWRASSGRRRRHTLGATLDRRGGQRYRAACGHGTAHTRPLSWPSVSAALNCSALQGFARDDAEIAYATFDCNLEACATYLLQEREKMAAATDYGDFF